jgi:hypothetical protein
MRKLPHFLPVPFLFVGILLAGGKSAALSLSKGAALSPAPSEAEGLSKGAAKSDPPVHIETYGGMCDASGASFLDADHFIVGNDEDNVLRIYRKDSPVPVKTLPLDGFIALNRYEKNPETDIEASARIGDDIYWMCSHGRNAEGKIRSNRQRLFAVRVKRMAAKTDAETAGRPYRNLIQDLLGDPKLKGLGLAEAAKPHIKRDRNLAPKKNGLNIEALSRMPGTRGLLIGFRNPAPGGKALLIPLLNPEGMIFREEKAAFGDPVLLDLGGFSVRSIEFVESLGAYLIIAGSLKGGDDFSLFTWSGREGDRALIFPCETAWMRVEKFTPEAFVVFPETGQLLLISDDGTLPLRAAGADASCPCKQLVKPEDRRFRGAWMPLNKR